MGKNFIFIFYLFARLNDKQYEALRKNFIFIFYLCVSFSEY